jgi:hypothetical protein
VPDLEDWFPPLGEASEVSVCNLENGVTFKKQIPAAYLFHLRWIMSEAFPTSEVNEAQHGRACWLRTVLDAFADEIQAIDDTVDWRSKVLNPILVREFYKADHFNEKHIGKQMRANRQLGGKIITTEHWEGFYLNQDVIGPVHRNRWSTTKPIYSIGTPTSDSNEGIIPPLENKFEF